MATSPNYAWAEPDNSSLVKNGASDIRTLGDAIDTSVWNVGFGQAGKNKIINGDFSINQRNFSSTTTNLTYGFDRFVYNYDDGTCTYSAQTFTVGTAPVSGYEATNYARLVTTGQTLASASCFLSQKIENVRTFAGQTVTVSFWAKAATGTPKIAIELDQQFGSGGSTRVTTAVGQVTLSTSWTRYSASVTVPSISGKTIGTSSFLNCNLFVSAGSNFNARTNSMGIQSNTFDIWGVQAEYASKATPFQTASGGSPQAELAMCQRYYQKSYNIDVAPATSTTVGATTFLTSMISSFQYIPTTYFRTQMRSTPTITLYSTTGASGKIRNQSQSTDLNAATQSAGSSAFSAYVNSVSVIANDDLRFQWTADIEL
jgi:hypothetical protein